MKKTWWIGMSVLALSIGTALAEGDATASEPVKKEVAAPAVKPELKDITAVGVVEKVTTKKGDDVFILKTEDGARIRLPKGKNAPDCASMVGSKVKISGKGFEMEKKGKKQCVIRSISSIEKVENQPAAN